jgi:hypothetical protein
LFLPAKQLSGDAECNGFLAMIFSQLFSCYDFRAKYFPETRKQNFLFFSFVPHTASTAEAEGAAKKDALFEALEAMQQQQQQQRTLFDILIFVRRRASERFPLARAREGAGVRSCPRGRAIDARAKHPLRRAESMLYFCKYFRT